MKPIVRTLQAQIRGSWHTHQGQLQLRCQDHIQGVTCLAFHPTNPTLFSGSMDKAPCTPGESLNFQRC